MFSDYTANELTSIFVMQGFSGLILFSVFLLMALGLAIIFGQMGIINMAHGEFMILVAYVTYLTSELFSSYFPTLFSGYFFIAIALAFVIRASRMQSKGNCNQRWLQPRNAQQFVNDDAYCRCKSPLQMAL